MTEENTTEDQTTEEEVTQTDTTEKVETEKTPDSAAANEARANFEILKDAVQDNPKFLEKIAETDKNKAEKISQKLYGQNLEKSLSQIEEEVGKLAPSVEDEILAKVEGRQEAKRAEEMKTDFYSKNAISGEFETDFSEIFVDITEGKTLTSKNVERFLKMALREAQESSKNVQEYEEAMLKLDKNFTLGKTARSGTSNNTPSSRLLVDQY